MAPRYLLDTNTCIYIRRRRPPAVLARFDLLQPGDAALSVITFGELLYGAAKSQDHAGANKSLEELATLTPVLPLPLDAAYVYGEIRADLETKGEVIGNNDLWIAAHARVAGLTLVTNNEKEFRRVAGLKIENWVV
jgi:tRNA(fMet)-specific endonuclease VapC